MISESAPFFSVCIPAYNRSQHLAELMDSILDQSYTDYEIVICEDVSPERDQIRKIVKTYMNRYNNIVYHENEVNIGYDANIRNLLERAKGKYCFFMGNDDVLCKGALNEAYKTISKYPSIGVMLRAYGWFDVDVETPKQIVRYFSEERYFPAGNKTIGTFFRRVGVISGFVVHRDEARNWATDKFDGYLYYQMYLAASVLVRMNGVYTPKLLTLSRDTEPPDFGSSENERGKFVPGTYTPNARLHMVKGMLEIAKYVEKEQKVCIYKTIRGDIANYIYPYIRDQLNLSFVKYAGLYFNFIRMGFWRYPLFHVHMWLGYILKMNKYDQMTGVIRKWLGHTPSLGRVYKGMGSN